LNIDRLGELGIDHLEVLLVDDDELPFAVLVGAHDVLPRDLLLALGAMSAVGNARLAFLVQQTELDAAVRVCGDERDGEADEADGDGAGPEGSHGSRWSGNDGRKYSTRPRVRPGRQTFSCSGSFFSASSVVTGLLMTSAFTMSQPTMRYVIMASKVDHSK